MKSTLFRPQIPAVMAVATLIAAICTRNAEAYPINPGSDPVPGCKECEEGSSSGDPGSPSNYSVDLALNVGRAPVERPVSYSAYFVVAGENLDEPSQPTSISALDSQFEGSAVEGLWPAQLRLKSPVINAACFNPASLTYKETFKMQVLKSGSTVRQVLTSDFLVDVQSLPSGQEGFVAKWWPASAKGAVSGGFYVPIGTPVKTLTVSNPDPFNTYTTLDVASWQEMPNATARSIHYRYVFENNGSGNVEHRLETWTKKPGEAGAVQVAADNLEFLSGAPVNGVEQNSQDRIRTIKQADLSASGAYGALTTVSRTREVYTDIGGKKRLASLTRLSSTSSNTDGLKTTYGYYNAPTNTLLHGQRRWQKNPDGSWKIWTISASETSQIIDEFTPFKDGTFVLADDGSNVGNVNGNECRRVRTITTGTSMTVTEYVLGQQVARVDKVILTGSGGERVTRMREFYTASQYFETYSAFNPYGNGSSAGAGRIAWKTHRDGTANVYSYGGGGSVTIKSGPAVGNGASAAPTVNTAGTTTVRLYNEFWEPVSEAVTDIASTAEIAYWEVPNPATDMDLYGRPERIEYNHNANDFQTITYGCCGPVETRDRSGAVTTTSYDLLKRIYKTTSKGSSTATEAVTTTDRSGLVTTTSRSSANVAAFDVSKAERNLLGETVKRWSADANGDGNMELTTILTEYPAGGGLKVTETDPIGATHITTTYRDGQTKTVSGTGVFARSLDYGSHALNGGGLWTQATRANGSEWEKTYDDSLGRTIRTDYPGGAYSLKTYHGPTAATGARGRLASMKDPDEVAVAGSGTHVSYAYGYNASNHEFTTVTEKLPDAQTRVTTVTSGVVSSVTLHGVTFGPAAFEATTVNGVATSESFRSADGYSAGSATFGRQTLTRRTVPADGSWTVTTTNPDSSKTRATYADGELDLTEVFDNQGTAAANLVASTGYTYDDLGRTLTTTDSRTGNTTVNGYRNSGAVVSVTTNGGNDTTTYTHDVLGRVIATTLPDTSVTHTSYTLTGEVEATWGSQTYPTFRGYDGQGRLFSLRTKPTLDTNGVPTNAGGSLTTWLYSSTRGWLVEKNYDGESDDGTTDPDYTYTAAGRLKTRTWERGVVTTYGYDQGMLETVTYSNDSTGTPALAYTYDALGRVRTVTQGSGGTANTHTYAYKDDDNGSGGTLGSGLGLHSETVAYGASGLSRTLIRHEDTILRPAGWQLKDGTSVDHSAGYGYDNAGRLQHVDPAYPLPGSPAFTYAYEDDSLGLLDTLTGPAHTVTNAWEATRDVLDTKTNADRAATPVTVSAFDYTVNNLVQRTGVDVTGTAFGSDQRDRTWGYDALGQVISENDATDNAHDRGFSYDAIGNRLASIEGNTDPTATGAVSYTPNALNQYSAINPGTAVNPGYDVDGNLTDDAGINNGTSGDRNFVWDAENRLIELRDESDDATLATYAYDYLGRRIRRTVSGGANLAYVYDGWNLIAEYDVSSTPSLVVKNLWGLDLSGSMQGAGGVGGLLSVTSSAGTFYPTFDGNGNVSEYLNSSGTNVAHFEYDAFGNVINFTEQSAGLAETFRYRFSTKPQDAESGLYYYGYRSYDPVAGKWASRDPIEEEGGVNLYTLGPNDPINGVDSDGRIWNLLKEWLKNKLKKKRNGKIRDSLVSDLGGPYIPSHKTLLSSEQIGICCVCSSGYGDALKISFKAVYFGPLDSFITTECPGKYEYLHALDRKKYGVTVGGHEDEIDSIRIIPGSETEEDDKCPNLPGFR